METIKLHSHIGSDGILHLEIPVGLINQDLDVIVVYQPSEHRTTVKTPEQLGWSPGFFERTFGAWEGEPLVREPQGELPEREPLE